MAKEYIILYQIINMKVKMKKKNKIINLKKFKNLVNKKGDYLDDQQEGTGKFYDAITDSTYIGSWIQGEKNGLGTLYTKSEKYVGDWIKDEKHGHGKLYTNDDHLIYEGEFKENSLNGQGVYYFKNGDKYDGFWKKDKRSGNGTIYFANGKYIAYTGNWSKVKYHGHGKLFYSDGRIFEGSLNI